MTGKVADDSSNTFTTRMLLLLEGRSLTNEYVLDEAREAIISSYWRDQRAEGSEFAPAFMSNDILRMWRTFCVNYEARTADLSREQRNERRLKNYKLKYCRLLTCYSAIIAMLDVFGKSKTVTKSDMLRISKMSPCERVLDLIDGSTDAAVRSSLRRIVDEYEKFLATTDTSDAELLDMFDNQEILDSLLTSSYDFARSIFDTINLVGKESKLHRMVVV